MEGRMWELSIPLWAPFTTAAGGVGERRVVLVSIEDGSQTGWGEAAPYPGVTPDTVDDAWRTLDRGTVLSPTAAAAVDEALSDLRARRAGDPLPIAIGGSTRAVPTSVAVGLDADPVDRLRTTGASSVKLKIRPGYDVETVERVRRAHPELPIGVDANGSYGWEDRAGLLALDAFGVEYVEQPFGADDLVSHARLRDEMVAAIALDEPIDSEAAAIAAIETAACDVLVVKPSRLGVTVARAIHDLALSAGLRIKASGLLETDVGRAHTRAVAALPAAVFSDVADASWYLSGGVIAGPGDRSGSASEPVEAPGIGFDPVPAEFGPYVVREAALASRIWD